MLKQSVLIAFSTSCLLMSCNTLQNATADPSTTESAAQDKTTTDTSTNKESTDKTNTSTDKDNAQVGKEVKVRELEEIATSQIQDAKQEVIKDEASFAKLWKEHTGVETGMPKVDFSKEMVLGVFMGEKTTGGYSIKVTKAEIKGTDLHVEVTETSPDPSLFTIQIITAPSHIVAVEKVEGKVEFKTKKVVSKGDS